MRKHLTLLLAALTLACAARAGNKGDTLAKGGNWEQALEEYTAASAAHPEDIQLIEKKRRAQREVAAMYVKNGNEAQVRGATGDAGEWWRRAYEVAPDETGSKSGRGAIGSNEAALDEFGDRSAKDKKWIDAIHAWAPLSALHPEKLELSNKLGDAHKQYAIELDTGADALAKKNLLGAALVSELRALQHDPLQKDAYTHSTEFRKSISGKSAISIPAVTIEDGGWWSIGNSLIPKLNSRLGEFPPYGPTRNQAAVPAQFVVTVVDFSWWDHTEHNLDEHKEAGAPKSGKVANPKRAAMQKAVADLEHELGRMTAGASLDQNAGPWISVGGAATPTPAPTPSKKGAKPAPAATPAGPARKALTARPATAEEISAKKSEIEKAKIDLAAMPEQVDASTVNAWYQAYTKTTRTLHAKIRVQVRESDNPEPVSKELEKTYEVSDRSNDADAAHGVAADPLKLPRVEEMIDPLVDGFVTDALAVIKDARERRIARWLDTAKSKHAAGAEDEALDAYVWAMFVAGFPALPNEGRTLIVSRLDGGDPRQIVAP